MLFRYFIGVIAPLLFIAVVFWLAWRLSRRYVSKKASSVLGGVSVVLVLFSAVYLVLRFIQPILSHIGSLHEIH
jgi:hypothetical protein